METLFLPDKTLLYTKLALMYESRQGQGTCENTQTVPVAGQLGWDRGTEGMGQGTEGEDW